MMSRNEETQSTSICTNNSSEPLSHGKLFSIILVPIIKRSTSHPSGGRRKREKSVILPTTFHLCVKNRGKETKKKKSSCVLTLFFLYQTKNRLLNHLCDRYLSSCIHWPSWTLFFFSFLPSITCKAMHQRNITCQLHPSVYLEN